LLLKIDLIVGQHAVLVGPQRTADIEGDESVLSWSRAERQTTLLVRTDQDPRGPEWERPRCKPRRHRLGVHEPPRSAVLSCSRSDQRLWRRRV